jgi:ABC-2 type transport system permease protein
MLLCELKMTFRNKQALFWRLFFPLIFIVIFGLFNLDSFSQSKVLVIDEADTALSHQIIDGLNNVDLFKIESTTKTEGLEENKGKLKRDEIDFILIIPASVKNLPDATTASASADPRARQLASAPAAITTSNILVYYNEANVATNQIVLNTLGQLTTEINANAAGAPKLFALEKEALSNKKVRYIDFLVPGVIAMSLMNSAVMTTAVYITEQREKKILKRILVTPVDRKYFIGAKVLSQLVVALIQVALLLAAGKLFYHVNIYGSYFNIIAIAILGSLTFINIGFIIAGLSRTAHSAESLAQIVTMPMMFLSGVFFSIETLPKIVNRIVTYLPLSPIIESLRSVIINGDGLAATSRQLYIVGGWVIVSFIIATLVFRLAKD